MKPFRLFYSFLLVLSLSACASVSIPTASPANPGDILYQEQFEDNTTGWDRVSNANGIMDYDGGGDLILIQRPSSNLWTTPERNFGDVRVEAEVTKQSGPAETGAGLMCRYQNG